MQGEARDFWRSSGYHLTRRDEEGHLAVTDALLRAYFNRPEVRPVEDSCDAERALHAALLEEPQRTVSDSEIAALADPDARENYRIVLAFRDRLTAAGTVEGAYLGCFETPGAVPVPPLFIGQMAHLIARNILAETEYPLRLRAGELLFREQKVTINDGFLMAADAETVELYASSGGFACKSSRRAAMAAPNQTQPVYTGTQPSASARGASFSALPR